MLSRGHPLLDQLGQPLSTRSYPHHTACQDFANSNDTRTNRTCWKYLENWRFQLHFDVEKLHSNTFWNFGLLVLIHCDQPSWSHSRHHVVQQVVAFAQDCVPGCPRGIQISSTMQRAKKWWYADERLQMQHWMRLEYRVPTLVTCEWATQIQMIPNIIISM